jgi:MFS family permease
MAHETARPSAHGAKGAGENGSAGAVTGEVAVAASRLTGQRTPWHAGLTSKHWRTLWGSYLGWIFDGYEAYALIVTLPVAMKALLTSEQAQTLPFYAGSALGITLLGWGIGGILGGIAADYIGRKRTMMLAVFFYALFTGLTAFAWNFTSLALLRFITGVAIGSEWSTGIALVAETWPDRARPKGCGFLQSGFGAGALLAAFVWFALSAYNPFPYEPWRIIFALGALPAFCVLYIRRALEESERWAAAVRSKHWAATEDAVENALPQTSARPFTLTEIFREPESRRRILLAMLMSLATTVGWWAVSSWIQSYTEQLAKELGQPAGVWGPRMGIVYNIGAVIAYLMSGFLADALGRRKFMLLAFAGAWIMSAITYTWHGSLPVFMIIAFFNGVFTLGLAYSWMAIYVVELFTSPVRATAASVVFNGARLIAWIFPILAGWIVANLGGISNAALILSSIYALGLIIPWFMPETAGKPLPE